MAQNESEATNTGVVSDTGMTDTFVNDRSNHPHITPKVEDPTTWVAYLWRITQTILNNPLLLVLLIVLIITVIAGAIYSGYDILSPIARRIGMEKITPTQSEHLYMIGTYHANWTAKETPDDDIVSIESVSPLGKNGEGSMIKGKACSPNLGAYTFEGIINERVISLTYVCSPKSDQLTTVGTILLMRTPNGLFEGDWYGWKKHSAHELDGGKTIWSKVSDKAADDPIFSTERCKY